MAPDTDETLFCRSAAGDRTAFTELVRRHERPLANLIRYRVGNADDADDVLQETLLQAWIGLRRVRGPDSFRGWLMRIAQNRCRDFLRSEQRRGGITSSSEPEASVNRFGSTLARERELLDEVIGELGTIPADEREVAKLFYLEGFSIAEIAARGQYPAGTVKRRLHQARSYLREALGVTKETRPKMAIESRPEEAQPFPMSRPEIVITPIPGEPFAVDCPELRWWSVVPELGNSAMWAQYHPPSWELREVAEMRVVRPARVHRVDGVEIQVSKWEPGRPWAPYGLTLYGRLTEEKAQYLAESHCYEGDTINLWSFLDDGFDRNWGEMDRRIEDRGRFACNADGTFTQAHSQDDPAASGAGVFSVQIGGAAFTCLRVLQLEGPAAEVDTAVTEHYVTESGRTVLGRHYAPARREDVVTDASTSLVIDGRGFPHWYDCLTDTALGAAGGPPRALP